MNARDVTVLLREWAGGDARAGEELLPLVYDELRRVARLYMRRERPGHMLQATALVHEAYLRLAGSPPDTWQNRAQFFGLAAREMRRILVEHARERLALKRGGQVLTLPLEAGLDVAQPGPDLDVLALDQALESLGQLGEQHARIVELRYFGGLTNDEVALVLGVSRPTVERKWRVARAYLFRSIQGHEAPP